MPLTNAGQVEIISWNLPLHLLARKKVSPVDFYLWCCTESKGALSSTEGHLCCSHDCCSLWHIQEEHIAPISPFRGSLWERCSIVALIQLQKAFFKRIVPLEGERKIKRAVIELARRGRLCRGTQKMRCWGTNGDSERESSLTGSVWLVAVLNFIFCLFAFCFDLLA